MKLKQFLFSVGIGVTVGIIVKAEAISSLTMLRISSLVGTQDVLTKNKTQNKENVHFAWQLRLCIREETISIGHGQRNQYSIIARPRMFPDFKE